MTYYYITSLPNSTITKAYYHRVVLSPNVTITELVITELFYYGLLLPNVAHSWIRVQEIVHDRMTRFLL